jgi:hypothetical protein
VFDDCVLSSSLRDRSHSGGFKRFVYGILSTLVSQSVDTLKGFAQKGNK